MNEGGTNKADAQQGWGPIRASLTVVLLCGSLLYGFSLRNRLESRGITVPPRQMGSLEAENTNSQPQIPLMTYYSEIEKMLKEHYVDPVTNEDSLADGAVRGMVSSLADSHSNFYSKEMAAAYLDRQKGDFAGIGIDIETRQSSDQSIIDASALHPTSDVQVGRVPDLYISAAAPGSPAEKAGLKPGDQINYVNGSWVVNQAPLQKLEALAKKASHNKQAADEFTKLLVHLRVLADTSMTANKAMEDLETGTSGPISVGVLRGGKQLTFQIQKGLTKSLETAEIPGGGIRLRFTKGAADFLKSHLGSGTLTIDLRDQPNGSFTDMMDCLKEIMPKGSYGVVRSLRKDEAAVPLVVSGTGSSPSHRFKLLVNSGTRGAAAIFALVLQKAGQADLEGTGMQSAPYKTAFNQLEDGTAYTLALGIYSQGQEKAK